MQFIPWWQSWIYSSRYSSYVYSENFISSVHTNAYVTYSDLFFYFRYLVMVFSQTLNDVCEWSNQSPNSHAAT